MSLPVVRDNVSPEDTTNILKLQVKNILFLQKLIYIRADTREEHSLSSVSQGPSKQGEEPSHHRALRVDPACQAQCQRGAVAWAGAAGTTCPPGSRAQAASTFAPEQWPQSCHTPGSKHQRAARAARVEFPAPPQVPGNFLYTAISCCLERRRCDNSLQTCDRLL